MKQFHIRTVLEEKYNLFGQDEFQITLKNINTKQTNISNQKIPTDIPFNTIQIPIPESINSLQEQSSREIIPTDFLTLVPPFIYVKPKDLQSLIKNHASTNSNSNFTILLNELLQLLNIIPNFTEIIYNDIFKKLDIRTCIENVKSKYIQRPQNPAAGARGGSKPKSYKKTSDKFKHNNRNYVVYTGTRSGMYIKLNGGYKSVKTLTRYSAL